MKIVYKILFALIVPILIISLCYNFSGKQFSIELITLKISDLSFENPIESYKEVLNEATTAFEFEKVRADTILDYLTLYVNQIKVAFTAVGHFFKSIFYDLLNVYKIFVIIVGMD